MLCSVLQLLEVGIFLNKNSAIASDNWCKTWTITLKVLFRFNTNLSSQVTLLCKGFFCYCGFSSLELNFHFLWNISHTVQNSLIIQAHAGSRMYQAQCDCCPDNAFAYLSPVMMNQNAKWWYKMNIKKWNGLIDVGFSASWRTGEQNKWTSKIPFWAEAQREEI